MSASIVRTAFAHPEQRAAILRRLDETAAPATRLMPGFRGAFILMDADGATGHNLTLGETQEQATRVVIGHAPARRLPAGLGVSCVETTTCEVARHIER